VAVEFDAAKDARNVAKHGISLARAADLEVHAVERDPRQLYGEPRFRAWGLIDGMAWCLAFTLRGGRVRAISLRRAGAKEWRERRGG
jgi:uncharacterized DUF497 family protein